MKCHEITSSLLSFIDLNVLLWREKRYVKFRYAHNVPDFTKLIEQSEKLLLFSEKNNVLEHKSNGRSVHRTN